MSETPVDPGSDEASSNTMPLADPDGAIKRILLSGWGLFLWITTVGSLVLDVVEPGALRSGGLMVPAGLRIAILIAIPLVIRCVRRKPLNEFAAGAITLALFLIYFGILRAVADAMNARATMGWLSLFAALVLSFRLLAASGGPPEPAAASPGENG